MKVRLRKRSLPRCFSKHPKAKGILAEADIGVSPHSRLRAKLLVFKNPTALHRFWKTCLGAHFSQNLGRHCMGAVNRLGIETVDTDNGNVVLTENDPRYFCIIGLIHGRTDAEIVAHEACHAGFAYAARVKRKWPNSDAMDEERVCYPVGRITAAINDFLHAKKLYI